MAYIAYFYSIYIKIEFYGKIIRLTEGFYTYGKNSLNSLIIDNVFSKITSVWIIIDDRETQSHALNQKIVLFIFLFF